MDKFLDKTFLNRNDGSFFRTMPMQWRKSVILTDSHPKNWRKRKKH